MLSFLLDQSTLKLRSEFTLALPVTIRTLLAQSLSGHVSFWLVAASLPSVLYLILPSQTLTYTFPSELLKPQ